MDFWGVIVFFSVFFSNIGVQYSWLLPGMLLFFRVSFAYYLYFGVMLLWCICGVVCVGGCFFSSICGGV